VLAEQIVPDDTIHTVWSELRAKHPNGLPFPLSTLMPLAVPAEHLRICPFL